MSDLLLVICWYLCEAWRNVRFVAYDLLVSVRGMKRCTICCPCFSGIWAWKDVRCVAHDCWCEVWQNVRCVAHDLLVFVRGMKKMYDLLLITRWYLCEAWKIVRFVAYDLLVSVPGMTGCTIFWLWLAGICARQKNLSICCLWFAGICARHEKCTISCLWFAVICARHEKMYHFLPTICWYLCEAWKKVRFVAYDLLVSVRGMKRCTICCLWFAGICARHEKMYDLLPMICWYLCEAWKDVRFVAYDVLVSVRGMKRWTICCLWFAGICARHEKM